MLQSVGVGSTKRFSGRAGAQPHRGPVNGSMCVRARARCGRVRGSPAAESRSRSQDPPSLTTVADALSQLAHAIRLLLEYTDSDYEEKKYTMGDGNGILLLF